MDLIDQFMWGYQTHFRHGVQILSDSVLERIGAGRKSATAILIGVKRPDQIVRHETCVEPENGPVNEALFRDIGAVIEAEIPHHPNQKMFYGDEPSMRAKPENIRRLVIQEQIKARLQQFDQKTGVQSFIGSPQPVESYYVCPIVQIRKDLLERFPPIHFEAKDAYDVTELNFIKACLYTILDESSVALLLPDPGRSFGTGMRSAEEVVTRTASHFMRSVSYMTTGHDGWHGLDLFAALNRISALKYERIDMSSRLVLTGGDVAPEHYLLRFAESVPLSQARWARKLFQLITRDAALVGTSSAIFGAIINVATFMKATDKTFTINFPSDRQWILSHHGQDLLHVYSGEARLPQEPISKERFTENLQRVFSNSSNLDENALWTIFRAMQGQPKGLMVVIAADAVHEADRLAHQSTRIDPTFLTADVLERACRIDGTILIDPQGLCHAIGVILDGTASDKCTPSRGARFNSAVRYVGDRQTDRMAIVISDDTSLDVIPLLRPRISRADLEDALAAFEAATLENYHRPRSYLDEHRFYLSKDQCDRANKAAERIRSLPMEVGRIHILTPTFTPHSDMNQSYLY